MDRHEQFEPQAATKASIDKVLESQQPLAVEEVARLRRVNPDKSPAELSSYRNRTYLHKVRGIGAAAGLAAIGQRAPRDPREFQQASALYMLTIAEIHRLHPEDFERRTQLLEFVLAGNVLSRATTSEPVMSRTVPHLSKKIIDSIPMSAINRVNDVVGHPFVTKWGTVRGEFVLGQQLPIVIGGGHWRRRIPPVRVLRDHDREEDPRPTARVMGRPAVYRHGLFVLGLRVKGGARTSRQRMKT